MNSGESSCARTRCGVVRVNCIMDSGNRSCSRTRSGLVRANNILDPSDSSFSRTRSGLVRRKSFTDSSDVSCSRTRSGLVRRKSFTGSRSGSCSVAQNGLVRGSPAVKELIKDDPAIKVPPDEFLEEEIPSRTRSGLVRRSPTVKREDMPVGTRSGLVRENPAIKTPSKDEPVIKGLAAGWLKEDKPHSTRSGLVRGSLHVKASIDVEPVEKGQSDGWLKEDKHVGTQSGLVRGSQAIKSLSKDESAIEGLPDGWRKEYRPRKPGSSQKNDPYYIDPVSGYEFRSLKDVYRYLQTGDIRQCAMRPKKGTIYDVCIIEDQTHTSTSSQQTRPATADKAIQCEILTSEGIMLSWEELFSSYRGNSTEHTMLPEPETESMKAMDRCVKEVLEQNSVQSVSAQCAPKHTQSVKRKDQNVEVKSKKRKTSPADSPVQVSPCLAAQNIQNEVSIEHERRSVNVNLVNRVLTKEENTNDQLQMRKSGTANQIPGNEESTLNQLWPSQADTASGMQVMQETITDHLQPSQVDTVNHIQTNQENTAHQLQSCLADTVIPRRTMQEYTTVQPSQADTMNHIQKNQEYAATQLQSSLADTLNHIQRNQENTAHQLQSSLEDTVISMRTMQEYTMNQVSQADTVNLMQMNQHTANELHPSLPDTVIPLRAALECASDHSQQCSADRMNHILANQEDTADQSQLSQANSVTQIETMQENITTQSQLRQAESVNQIHMNLENPTNHLQPNYAENPLLQGGFSWAPEQNGEALVDFWTNVENQASSVPMQIDGAPVASFPANVKFQNAAGAAAEPVIPTAQAALPAAGSDQSGLAFPSLFGNAWSDPCIEFAFKTLTGDIPVLDDTAAVTDYFPQQQDLNKGTTPNCSASAFDNSMNRTQVDVNLPLPRPSDGSWFPPQ